MIHVIEIIEVRLRNGRLLEKRILSCRTTHVRIVFRIPQSEIWILEDLSEEEKENIIKYIKKNFIVSVEGEKKNLILDRFVFEGSDYTETANIVFTTEETFGERKLSIKNTILFDVLEEQTNIVGVKIKDTKRTLTFNKNKKENWVLIN